MYDCEASLELEEEMTLSSCIGKCIVSLLDNVICHVTTEE